MKYRMKYTHLEDHNFTKGKEYMIEIETIKEFE